ncbi:MAG TPA: NAD-dependent succinate-semialdehyde dehydrogenase [Bryobacteraceae bacterium]|nr:NAD-dependent succinate-semialdehyde dehydrogenase [Bryobacteraceae bacterium]
MAIASINPASGKLLAEFAPLSSSELNLKLDRAVEAFHHVRKLPFRTRAERMTKAADVLESGKRKFAEIMTAEMGKTLTSAVAEVEKCASACRYYAANAERQLADETIETNASRSFVHYQPLGPVLAIMPWNFPFWQVFRFASPALMAGNVGLLKHASNVPQCALAIERIFMQAGFPEGGIQTLLIDTKQVEQVLDDARVMAATLTGSERAGQSVAARAGRNIKKTVLELGGSDPFIVMPTANFEDAVSTAVKARTINNGQSCIAAKRFIIADEIYDAFEANFVERMRSLRVGDPMDPVTEIGPLATDRVRDDLDLQVKSALESGARVLTGGRKIEGAGNFYEPTVLVNVHSNSTVFRQELFGPVAMLFRARDMEEAIEIANDSNFGLASSFWSNDADEIARAIDELQAGQVFVNSMVASDPRLPFGGIKRSGYGRELGSFGIKEFVNVKTVSLM